MFEAISLAAVAAELTTTADAGSVLLQEGGGPMLEPSGAAALSIGLAALATGYAQRGIGSAAVGAVAEDSDNLIAALLFTALPETLIIIAFAAAFLL